MLERYKSTYRNGRIHYDFEVNFDGSHAENCYNAQYKINGHSIAPMESGLTMAEALAYWNKIILEAHENKMTEPLRIWTRADKTNGMFDQYRTAEIDIKLTHSILNYEGHYDVEIKFLDEGGLWVTETTTGSTEAIARRRLDEILKENFISWNEYYLRSQD